MIVAPGGRWRLLAGHLALPWIQIIFLVDAIGRGLDYSYPPGTSTLTLATVEQAAPIQWWGIAIVAGALCVVAGQLVTIPTLSIVGEVILGALLTGLGGSLFLAVMDRLWWEGFRTGLTLMCVGATHFALAYAITKSNRMWRWSDAPASR